MGPLESIGAAMQALANALGLVKQRDAEKNTPDMNRAAVARREAEALDQTRKAIAKRDLDEIRRETAE